MEKDALLEIIIHDLKEVEIMAENAKGDKQLSKAYFKLSRNRINSILDEIEMLEEISLPVSETQATESKKTPAIQDHKENSPVIDQEKEEKNNLEATKPKETELKDFPEHETPEDKSVPSQDETTQEKETEQEPTVTNVPDEKAVSKEDIPVPSPEPEKKPDQEKKKENQVLGEKLVSEKSSFNEQIGKHQKSTSSQRSFSAPPISDLKKAMGINDRFFFQRELFGGSADVMNQTLEQLNDMHGINEAQNFLLANFNWDPENEAVLSFMELVERRYL
ncbi:hypothetical protein [Marinilabilia salmonicolor]|jgi:outer membrane biosynthesis protein TonB|uniref:Uncharacterized protein n=1 Tax=Marinilabilia salmonicolor TaxID=989 RepID=A0A2T0XDE8_9BACT|nr:hypothetical protein [Marinilabilia salmonicolor]PRY96951.1 hypothetical protein BY457_11324 [Marinilabilia salmonicolor]RCW36653.1 hypothetical protein DFO77_10895 [Marinilabilia salmonicolor]